MSKRNPVKRWSARRKQEVVLWLLRGESLDALSRETGQLRRCVHLRSSSPARSPSIDCPEKRLRVHLNSGIETRFSMAPPLDDHGHGALVTYSPRHP